MRYNKLTLFVACDTNSIQLLQNPDSFIALKWCVENGVYPDGWEPERANKLLEEKKAYLKKHGSLTTTSSPKKKTRRKKKGSNIVDSTELGDTSSVPSTGWETGSSTDIA